MSFKSFSFYNEAAIVSLSPVIFHVDCSAGFILAFALLISFFGILLWSKFSDFECCLKEIQLSMHRHRRYLDCAQNSSLFLYSASTCPALAAFLLAHLRYWEKGQPKYLATTSHGTSVPSISVKRSISINP